MITTLFQKLHFIKVVAGRFFKILFRKHKKIELLQLEYDRNPIFQNGYLIINYRFKNAIYYGFNHNKTLEKQIKIFDLTNIEHEFNLIVYGFFQKKEYQIKIEPQLNFKSQNFKTKFKNLATQLEFQQIENINIPSLNIKQKKQSILLPKIKVRNHPIIFKSNSFNQNDFI
ncbi:hypothetical protein FFWV33_12310 [Flavobacterium faecale]|uniref:Uncharacterized protein n=1 Tax=Flavobacterium faecale TaxID=1355330 RepID=A0A2S1LEQ4_9FLAO|nr:hypothetical protein FFWV33_12310 [Flavobacterium faecale]